MKLETITELYDLLSSNIENNKTRQQAIKLRKKGLNSINNFTKVAFDTRRINQETEYNPRRGLQNYHRSEQFISEAISKKLLVLVKLRNVLEQLKLQYGKESEWQDSYARVLLNTINNGLRKDLNDGDFTEMQPGTGSLDYIEELLYVRYRLNLDKLSELNEDQIKEIILSKDEDLINKNVNKALEITKHDIVSQSYNDMMDKMFKTMEINRMANQPYDPLINKLFDVKANAENPEIERTVTITIKDSLKK